MCGLLWNVLIRSLDSEVSIFKYAESAVRRLWAPRGSGGFGGRNFDVFLVESLVERLNPDVAIRAPCSSQLQDLLADRFHRGLSRNKNVCARTLETHQLQTSGHTVMADSSSTPADNFEKPKSRACHLLQIHRTCQDIRIY